MSGYNHSLVDRSEGYPHVDTKSRMAIRATYETKYHDADKAIRCYYFIG